MKMISLKTGALIRCSVEVGANVASPGNFEITNKFRRSGIYLGYLFQITDDILGVWGLEEETGKSIGSDLKRKKNSLPIVHAMSASSQSYQSAIQGLYRKEELSDCDVLEILDILDCTDSRSYCQDLAEIYAGKAIDVIDDANIDKEKLKEYQDLCEYLTVRKF
jgi:geranylgeranyl diphosphate synthase type I